MQTGLDLISSKCLPCPLKEVERDHVSILLHSPNPKVLPGRDLHLAAPSRLALDRGRQRQAEDHQPKVIDGTELEMGGSAAEVQQGVCRGVGAKAELDSDIENAVTRVLQAVTPHYPKVPK